MKRSRDEVKGWVGSILFHAVLAALLFTWSVQPTASGPEYVELQWAMGALPRAAAKPSPAAPRWPDASSTTNVGARKNRPVDLPQQRKRAAADAVRVPAKGPALGDAKPQQEPVMRPADRAQEAVSMRDQAMAGSGGSRSSGQQEEGSPGAREAGSDMINAQVDWADGISRRLISGEMPVYPRGVNVEALIRVETVVEPGGRVKSVRPILKGNPMLEEEAMRKVLLWRFEPLGSRTIQRDQICRVTFNFRLQ